jgi:protein-arginine kinase activator protein McsA
MSEEKVRKMEGIKETITVWVNGDWKIWSNLDAEYAANDSEWLVNIPCKEIEESRKQRFVKEFCSEEVAYCPKCEETLEKYSHSKGGWCPKCKEWFPDDIIQERMEENE